jgi:hypothetical protein
VRVDPARLKGTPDPEAELPNLYLAEPLSIEHLFYDGLTHGSQPSEVRHLASLERCPLRPDPQRRQATALQGFVVDWKRDNRGNWHALVVYHDEAALKPAVTMDWLPSRDLIPIPVDPNFTGR